MQLITFWTGQHDLLEELGSFMLYDTKPPIGPWYDVVDVRYILGPAMLAPNFENNSGTIPAAGARYKASCFPLGMPDNARTEGTGSNLYYVNKYALKFGGKTLSSEWICLCQLITVHHNKSYWIKFKYDSIIVLRDIVFSPFWWITIHGDALLSREMQTSPEKCPHQPPLPIAAYHHLLKKD